jgi:hypothetical protein
LICSDKLPIEPNQTDSHEPRPVPNVHANIHPSIPQAEIPVGKPHSKEAEQIIPRILNHKFSYSDLQRITNDFKINIGTGGYGSVYLGYLENGFQVAVKMLSQSSGQGIREFLAEVITISPQLLIFFFFEKKVNIISPSPIYL